MRDMSIARLLVVSDVLAKSVVLAHDEREVAKVFETIEPFVRELASAGKFFRNRRGILRLIGEALLVQHNVAGRVAITEKPDALWDRPDLERLYARLEDEYELTERVLRDRDRFLPDLRRPRRALRAWRRLYPSPLRRVGELPATIISRQCPKIGQNSDVFGHNPTRR
jgi:uncharacterized Rmd1/YagE family protein